MPSHSQISKILERNKQFFSDKNCLFYIRNNPEFSPEFIKNLASYQFYSPSIVSGLAFESSYVQNFSQNVSQNISQNFSQNSEKSVAVKLTVEHLCPENLIDKADAVVLFWLKDKKLMLMQISHLLAHLKPDSLFYLVGENNSGVKSIEKMLGEYISVAKLDNARHCLLYQARVIKNVNFNLTDFCYNFNFADLKFTTLTGAFGANKIDDGTRFLLENIDPYLAELEDKKILDLCAGFGAIGAYVKHKYPQNQVFLSEYDAIGVFSQQQTLDNNNLAAEITLADKLQFSDQNWQQQRFDLILCNPPFHNERKINFNTINQIIHQSVKYMKFNAKFIIVANSFLDYEPLLQQRFQQVKVVSTNNRFKVIVSCGIKKL